MGSSNQIFFDETGNRKKYVNRFLIIIIIIFLVFASYVLFYVIKLNQLNNVARTIQDLPLHDSSKTVMLYTDNHPNAYSVLSDQIENLNALIVPKYLVTTKEIVTTNEYRQLLNDADSVSENRPVNYKKYYLISSKNYSQIPFERSYVKEVDSNLPGLLSESQMQSIRDDLDTARATGLIIDFDINLINSAEKVKSYNEWLNRFNNILGEKNLTFGISFNTNMVDESSTSLLSGADLLYVAVNYHEQLTRQISDIERNRELFSKPNAIFELPTISSATNTNPNEMYEASVSYASNEQYLLNLTISNRGVEPIVIEKANYVYSTNDAITAYSYIKKLGSAIPIEGQKTQFSIASPAYEEYTTWKLLTSPFDDIRNNYLLSENTTAALSIDLKGEGQVYRVDTLAMAGTRKIDISNSGQIISSRVEKKNASAVVNRSGKIPEKIALTFDDGPHPVSTRKVLDILDSYNVKGTFFLVGENVLAYPNIAKEIVERGHEVENHTYSHPIFSRLDTQSQLNQIKSNSDLIEQVTGKRVKFFRKPYSDSSAINTESDIVYLNELKGLSLQASEYDIDSKDWLLDNADQVVEKVKTDLEKSSGKYSQILLHDAHKNPGITLEALPRIIEYLKSKNIEIVRVDELIYEENSQVFDTTKTYRALQGKDLFFSSLIFLNLIVVILASLRYLWITWGAIAYKLMFYFDKHRQKTRDSNPIIRPRLGIIVACYNEEKVIAKTIESMLSNSYQNFRIVIVNDGSKDNTASIVNQYAKKDKRIELINLPNGGKAKALEIAAKRVRNKWLVFCDADTVFRKDSLQNFVNSIQLYPEVGAVAGKVIVGNDINTLTRCQAIEYGIAHIFTKSTQHVFNTITVVPGAVGLWNRKALVRANWFSSDTLAEDADTTMAVVALGKRVVYNSEAAAKTEAPHKLSLLYKQRTRWQLGNMQAIIKHRRGLFNRRYGALGFIGLPLFYIEILNTLLFPLLLLFSILAIYVKIFNIKNIFNDTVSIISSADALKIGIVIITTEFIITCIVILLEPKKMMAKMRLFISLPYYFFFYKFFLSYATLVALLRALRGSLQSWGYLKRSATVKDT